MPFHVEALRTRLQRHKEQDPRYSLRRFAQQLGMDPSALSRVLAGKEPLSAARARSIAGALRMSRADRKNFLDSVAESWRRRLAGALQASLVAADDGFFDHLEIGPGPSDEVLEKFVAAFRALTVGWTAGAHLCTLQAQIRVRPAESVPAPLTRRAPPRGANATVKAVPKRGKGRGEA